MHVNRDKLKGTVLVTSLQALILLSISGVTYTLSYAVMQCNALYCSMDTAIYGRYGMICHA